MSVIRKLASQTAIYGLSTMLGRLINYLLVPLYTRTLVNVADYGVVGVMFGYASLGAVLFAFGLETGFFNFARKQEKPEPVFATAAHFLLLTGLIWILLSRFFGLEIMTFIGYPHAPEYAFWFTVILASDAVSSLAFAYLRQQQKPWNFAWVRLSNIAINVIANLFFLVFLPYWGKSHEWALHLYYSQSQVSWIFISNLIASTATLLMLFPVLKHLRLGMDIDLLKRMLKYSYPIVFIGLAGMINETFDRILIKSIVPDSQSDYQVSIYSAFYKLSMVLTLFVQAFRFAVEPYFFEQAKQLNAQESYAYIMKWFVYVVSVIYLGTLLILPYIAPILIQNPEYFQHPDGMKIVPYLLAANLFLGLYYTLSVWYKVSEKTHIGAIPAFTGAAITLILNLWLIPKIGILGAAITTLITYFSMVLVGYFLSRKYYPIPYDLPRILITLSVTFLLGYILINAQLGFIGKSLIFIAFLAFLYLYETRTSHATRQNHQ
jgi:O-antigen/teichoic acid export membrane protein